MRLSSPRTRRKQGNRPTCVYLAIHDPRYGGSVYESEALAAIASRFDTKIADARRTGVASRWRSLGLARGFERRCTADLWLRPDLAAIAASQQEAKKSIAVIHHVDPGTGRVPGAGRLLARQLRSSLRRVSAIVVVSDYWKRFLLNWDLDRIHVIYNGFDTTAYHSTEPERIDLKLRLGLDLNKPLIYVGNAQRQKGIERALSELPQSQYQLIATGLSDSSVPVPTIYLGQRDYRILLGAADLVLALSTMPEGWSRTAHEALLAGTPVIGSGSGGMGELLHSTGQKLCSPDEPLQAAVDAVLADQYPVTRQARHYAESFDRTRFRNEWVNLARRFECHLS